MRTRKHHHYTDAQIEYLCEIAKDNGISQIVKKFTEKFDLENITPLKIRTFLNKKHIKFKKRKILDEDKVELFKSLNIGRSVKDTKTACEDVGIFLTEGQIKRLRHTLKIKSGLDGRFKKGHTSWNKGHKGECGKGSEKGWFKKGATSLNHLEMGTETVDIDGYTYVKVDDKKNVHRYKNWKLKHRLIYEQHYGKIPDGYNVIFLDGNKQNFDIKNLIAISDTELMFLNNSKTGFGKTENADINKTLLLAIRLKLKAKEIRNEK